MHRLQRIFHELMLHSEALVQPLGSRGCYLTHPGHTKAWRFMVPEIVFTVLMVMIGNDG